MNNLVYWKNYYGDEGIVKGLSGKLFLKKALKISWHCLFTRIFSQGVCVFVCVCMYVYFCPAFCQKGVGHIFLYRYLSSVPTSQEWGEGGGSIDLGEGDSSSVKRTGAWYWSNYKLQFSLEGVRNNVYTNFAGHCQATDYREYST